MAKELKHIIVKITDGSSFRLDPEPKSQLRKNYATHILSSDFTFKKIPEDIDVCINPDNVLFRIFVYKK